MPIFDSNDLKPAFLRRSGALMLLGVCALFLNCTSNRVPSTAPTDATSASEVVAAIISGTVNVTTSNGTQTMRTRKKEDTLLARIKNEINLFPRAEAITTAGTCPSLQAGGTNCSVNGTIMTLNYQTCNFAATTAGNIIWLGNMYLSSTNSASPVTWTCGTFPTFAAGNVVVRSFSAPTERITIDTSTGAPILGTLLDTSLSTNGSNPPVQNSGITITFSGAVARTIVINGIHIGANSGSYNVWDYELNTNSTGLSVSGANSVTSGSVTIQDMRSPTPSPGRTGTSNITSSLTYSAGCCMPTGGTITTSWNDGTATETLNFTGTCGTAQLNGKNITLNQCL